VTVAALLLPPPSRWSCKRRWEQQCDAVFVEVPPSLSEPRRWCRGGSEEEGPLRVGSSCARHMDARGAWVQAAGGLARSGLAGHLFGWRRPVRERDDNTPLAGRPARRGPASARGRANFSSEKSLHVHVSALELRYSENGGVFLPLQTCMDLVICPDAQSPTDR
jgi:hypothetical protein